MGHSLIPYYRCGPRRIKYILRPEQIIQAAHAASAFLRCSNILPHPIAVQIASSLTEKIISDLHPVLTGIHCTEIAESFFVEIGIYNIRCQCDKWNIL